MRDGMAPYLAIFLKTTQAWNAEPIGIALAASFVASALFQVPAGLMVDRLHAKRLLLESAGLGLAAGCLMIVRMPVFPAVIGAQIVIGFGRCHHPTRHRGDFVGPGRPGDAGRADQSKRMLQLDNSRCSVCCGQQPMRGGGRTKMLSGVAAGFFG